VISRGSPSRSLFPSGPRVPEGSVRPLRGDYSNGVDDIRAPAEEAGAGVRSVGWALAERVLQWGRPPGQTRALAPATTMTGP